MIGHNLPELAIGLSGWNYPGWKHDFYQGLPQKRWLGHAVQHFNAIEVNGSFYKLQSAAALARWYAETPPGFIFTAKGHRFVTHNKKLLDPDEPIARCRANLMPLGEKLHAMLWQLPERFAKNLERLERFCLALHAWPETRHVMELRHTSWFDDETADCLARHRVANCISDAARWPMWERVTTDLVYIRLHGHSETYVSSYSRRELGAWAKKIRAWREEGRAVHVYFDNDGAGAAPWNALSLAEILSDSA
jgi:uncharacterized protein YecE (DUF72 family)